MQPHLHPPHPRWRVGVGRERGGGRIGVDEWRMVGGGGVGPLAAKPPRRRQQQAEAGELQHEEQQPIQESPSGKAVPIRM